MPLKTVYFLARLRFFLDVHSDQGLEWLGQIDAKIVCDRALCALFAPPPLRLVSFKFRSAA